MRMIVATGLLACVFAGAAKADDCKPLQYLTGVPISMDHGAVLLPITLNQKTAMMMFDTGGTANQLTRSTVSDLKLQVQESPLQLLDASGNKSNHFVAVDQVAIGALNLNKMEFQVSTFDHLSKDNIAGLISNSILRALDVDLDFGASRLNFFSSNHCPGKVVYWPADSVAAVPIQRDDSYHIVVPVTVDGHLMRAIIDTGATYTTMNMTDAKRLFDLSPGAPDMVELKDHPNDDKKLTVYRHGFSSLSLEGVTVKNPSMLVMPDHVNSKEQYTIPGSRLPDNDVALPELTIGLDIVKKLHIYFSYKEGTLYVAPADSKAGKLLPAVAGPPAVLTAPATATPPS